MQKSVAPGVIAVIIIVIVAVLALVGWKMFGTKGDVNKTNSKDQREQYFKNHPETQNKVGQPEGGYQRR